MHVRYRMIAGWVVAGTMGLAFAVAAAQEAAAPSPEQAAAAPLRAWNIDLAAVEPDAVPESAPELKPVVIVGARNGTFSGKVMVSGPLKDLKASASELRGEAGSIGADRVTVRYGAMWEGMDGWYRPHGLDMLLPSPREGAAVTSAWFTVTVPQDAKAGTYTGTVTLKAATGETTKVQVELKVADWTVPPAADFRTFIEMIQSPDTLAVEYGVPLWSDKHWALIARSLDLMRPLASRVVYLPLICETNLGNAESMVRWVPKADGTYDYDFAILDKYLDLVANHAGAPRKVVINAWDVYLKPADDQWDEKWWNSLSDEQRKNSYFRGLKERGDLRRKLQAEHGCGPIVTVVENGQVKNVHLPSYTDEATQALWKPLFDQLRERLKARGLEGTMTLGMLTDSWPSKEEAEALRRISGGLPWASHSHFSAVARRGGTVYGVADVGYETCVWDITMTDPDKEHTYGWKRDKLVLAHYRLRGMNGFFPTRMRVVPELNITGQQRGLGRVGADFWWAIKDKRGNRRGTVTERYPQSLWRNLDLKACLLAPGPDGAVATARYEHLREGLEECEARIAIEEALLEHEAALGADLVARCRQLLKDRHRAAWREDCKDEAFLAEKGFAKLQWYEQDRVCYEWFLTTNWQQRTEQLYALAGEVAHKLAGTKISGNR
ncbi:MAG: hypothetical protein JXL80_01555 [Planctomycetes bacterium]|nr:hypothetical protein [Planctomycetota bacterium]